MSTVSEQLTGVLRDANAYIDTHGWISGTEEAADGRVCLTGAIRLCNPQPGDAWLTRQVARKLDHAEDWNDHEADAEAVAAWLGGYEITDADLEATFGPDWQRVVDAVRASGKGGWGAYLSGANLRGANLTGAYLTGANLTSADLRGADLRGAYLRGAYLYGANLYDAYLSGANLRGAYLYGADLTGANLRGANLRGANLYGARLYGADLTGANLTRTNLTDARNLTLPAGWRLIDSGRAVPLLDGETLIGGAL